MEYLNSDKYVEARIDLQNAARKDPQNAEIRYRLANVALELGDADTAEKEIRRAISFGKPATDTMPVLIQTLYLQADYQGVLTETEILPDQLVASVQADILGYRALALLQEEQYRDSDATINLANEIAEDSLMALLARASYEARLGSRETAIKWTEKALAVAPASADAWALLGDLYAREDELVKAKAAFDKAIANRAYVSLDLAKRAYVLAFLGETPAAENDIKKLLSSGYRQHPYVMFIKGLIALQNSNYEEVRDSMRAVMEVTAGYLPARYYLGIANYNLGEYEQAATSLQQYITQQPGSISAAKALSTIYVMRGEYNQARETLEKAALYSGNDNDPEITDALGRLAMAEGDPDAALSYFKQLLEEDNSARNHYQAGLAYQAKGLSEAAQDSFTEAINIDPNHLDADIQLAISLLKQQKYSEALEYCSELRQKQGPRAEFASLEAAALLGLGEKEQAVQVLEQALEIQPGDPDVSHNLAKLALLDKDVDRAKAVYKEAMADQPGNEATIMRLARLETATGNQEAAILLVQLALESNPDSLDVRYTLATYYLGNDDPDQAQILLEGMQDKYANDPVFWEIQGRIELAQKNGYKAEKLLSRLVEARPNSADARYWLAQTEALAGKGDLVIMHLKEALVLDPSHLGVQMVLARIYAKNGRFDYAEIMLKRLQNQYPNNQDVFRLTGALALEQGDPEAAYSAYAKSLTLQPSPEDTIGLSISLFRMGKYEDGYALLDAWMNNHPDDANVQYHIANTRLLQGNISGAVSEFEKLLQISPDNVLVLNNLAWLLRETNPENAMRYASEALKLAPDSPSVLDTLSVLHLNAGDYERAIQMSTRAASLEPSNVVINYNLASALIAGGNVKKGQVILDELLVRDDLPEELRSLAETKLSSLELVQ